MPYTPTPAEADLIRRAIALVRDDPKAFRVAAAALDKDCAPILMRRRQAAELRGARFTGQASDSRATRRAYGETVEPPPRRVRRGGKLELPAASLRATFDRVWAETFPPPCEGADVTMPDASARRVVLLVWLRFDHDRATAKRITAFQSLNSYPTGHGGCPVWVPDGTALDICLFHRVDNRLDDNALVWLRLLADALRVIPGKADGDNAIAERQRGDPQDDDADDDNDDLANANGPKRDPHDTRRALWCGKSIFLGENNTQIHRLFWLLVTPMGRAVPLGDVQRAIDGKETTRDMPAGEVKRAAQRVRTVVSKLKKRLERADMDDHVALIIDSAHSGTEYSIVWRSRKKRPRTFPRGGHRIT